MTTLNQAINAFVALVQTIAPFKTVSLRATFASEIGDTPALYVIVPEIEFPQRAAPGMPPRRVIRGDIWVFDEPDENPLTFGSTQRDQLDALATALGPTVFGGPQNLGGLVAHAQLEGKATMHPGHMTEKSMFTVPFEILLP